MQHHQEPSSLAPSYEFNISDLTKVKYPSLTFFYTYHLP